MYVYLNYLSHWLLICPGTGLAFGRITRITALLARVFTETPVSRFYSLLPRDWVLEITVIVIVLIAMIYDTTAI